MTYHVIPINGDTGAVVRVLIVQAEGGDAWEVLAPEAEPQVLAREPGDADARTVEDRLVGYMRNTTRYAADRTREVAVDTHREALEAADRMLAPRGQLVDRRSDFSSDDWQQLKNMQALLDEVTLILRKLPTTPLVEVPEKTRIAFYRAQEAYAALERLTRRPLRPRDEPDGETHLAARSTDQPPPDGQESSATKPSDARPAKTPIQDLGLNGRCFAALIRAGINTSGQLAKLSDSQLRAIESIGDVAFKQIRAIVPAPGSALKGLPPYIRSLLESAGISTIEHLAGTPNAELRRIPRVGRITVDRIRAVVPRATSTRHRDVAKKPKATPTLKRPRPELTLHHGVIEGRNGYGGGYIRDTEYCDLVFFSRDDVPMKLRQEMITGRTVEFVVYTDKSVRKAINLEFD